MNPQLQPLIDLQLLDLRITEIKDLQRKLPDQLQAAEAPFRDAEQAVKQASTTVEVLAKDRRDKERDLAAHEANIQKLRDFSELKTNKEYQARLFEIEVANKRKGEMEEQLLLLMERIEGLQREAKQAQARAAEAESHFKGETARLEQVSVGLRAELAQLESDRLGIVSGVEKDLLVRYDKIKAMRKDLAVVPVRNGICTGCRLQLPPQLVAEVKRAHSLLACSYCHRILYWETEPPASSAQTTEPRKTPAESKS